MRSTSIAAYESILEHLSAKRGQVFRAMIEMGRACCDYQIAEHLGWPINCVTPRRGELARGGYIESDGVRTGPPTGREVSYWKINDAVGTDRFCPRPVQAPSRREKTVSQAARTLADRRRKKADRGRPGPRSGRRDKAGTDRKQLSLF